MNPVAKLALLALAAPVALAAGVFPNYGYQPPSDWTQPTFVLSQNYPLAQPAKPVFPWEAIDFTVEPEKYMQAVIAYCFEGNLAADFKPLNNPVRPWLHAPWLHYGPNGREFVNGLTGERTSRPYELAAGQTQSYKNVAVGFYNDLGGYAIGRVWATPTAPAPAQAVFPEGSVSFKLLFTTAPASVVPMLAGSPEWVADVKRSSTAAAVLADKVRLLQIDIAVKDKRSLSGGWIFGTFHYDASVSAANPWLKLRALTLQWGNDPALTPAMQKAGTKPAQSWFNQQSPIWVYRQNPPAGSTPPNGFGWAGRANGPVDNPLSACMSCHATAQLPAASPMLPPANLSDPAKLRWFRNLDVGEAFDAGSQSLEFSLQLGVGIQNFQKANPSAVAAEALTLDKKAKPKRMAKEFIFSRQ